MLNFAKVSSWCSAVGWSGQLGGFTKLSCSSCQLSNMIIVVGMIMIIIVVIIIDKRQREKQSRRKAEEGTVQSLTLLNVFFVNSLALYGDHQQWLRYLWKIFWSKLKGAWRLLAMEAANPGGQLDETPGNHTSHPDTKFSTRLFAWWLPWSWGTKPLQFPVRKFPR